MNISTTLVGILATLGISVIMHIVATVWWASRITALLENGQKSIDKLILDLDLIHNTYVRKEDYLRHQDSNKEHIRLLQGACEELRKEISHLSHGGVCGK